MTSDDKFKYLMDLDNRNAKVKITTRHGDVYYCKVDSPAEGEDDWAYHFFTPDYPAHYVILECNFIAQIEEITEEQWQHHFEEVCN